MISIFYLFAKSEMLDLKFSKLHANLRMDSGLNTVAELHNRFKDWVFLMKYHQIFHWFIKMQVFKK